MESKKRGKISHPDERARKSSLRRLLPKKEDKVPDKEETEQVCELEMHMIIMYIHIYMEANMGVVLWKGVSQSSTVERKMGAFPHSETIVADLLKLVGDGCNVC